MQSAIQELQSVLLRTIPLTQHIGLQVISYEAGLLILKAPLAPNINRQQTAFAGSLNALLTLAGWGQVWLILKDLNLMGEIVIQDSSSSYLRPVNSDLVAACYKPEQEQITRFATGLKKKGIARLELCAEIYQNDALAVSFKGRYVISMQRATVDFPPSAETDLSWRKDSTVTPGVEKER
jgi:thioesterase domain-containing protein